MSLSAKIGEWTEQQLARFIVASLRTTPASLPPSLALEELKTTRLLNVQDDIQLSPQAVKKLKKYLGLP